MRIAILAICLISSIGQIFAQEVSYWVGQSANPDPIMRHHEAFMDAFMKYIRNRPMEGSQVFVTETKGPESVMTTEEAEKSLSTDINTDSCRIETVASVTHEGQETLTISIGSGTLVKFESATESFSSGDTLQTKTLLEITYQDESNRSAFESVHEYYKECLTEKGTTTSASRFSYNCIYNSKYE